jgi:uncharacterized protein (TIGR03435 family)
MKKIMIIAGATLLATAMMAMVVEGQTAQVNDSYFDPDTDSLRQVPADLVVVRPTHFPQAEDKIRHYHVDDSLARTVGRNVSFREMMAEANDCNFSRVILPSDAPSGGFDFLVTTSGHVRQHLRKAIKEELGYTAHQETRDTDVFILKVNNSSLPGLTVSTAEESEDVSYKDGKLYMTHQQISSLLDGLSMGLNKPVLDQTSLTNYYNFSVGWNDEIDKSMHAGTWHVDGVQKALAGWGLGLETTNMPLDMYIVTPTP